MLGLLVTLYAGLFLGSLYIYLNKVKYLNIYAIINYITLGLINVYIIFFSSFELWQIVLSVFLYLYVVFLESMLCKHLK